MKKRIRDLFISKDNSSIGIMCPYSGGLMYIDGDKMKVTKPCLCIGIKCKSYNKDTKKCKIEKNKFYSGE